jgi:serine/threonine-protein kinase RsbT
VAPQHTGEATEPVVVSVPVSTVDDIIAARRMGRRIAARAGQSIGEVTEVATAISEIARNIVVHAGRGVMEIRIIEDRSRRGVKVTATDRGPGIDDVDRALRDGFTTGTGLGLGLPGARRLMDELVVASDPGRGTEITMYKWSRSPAAPGRRARGGRSPAHPARDEMF